MGNLNDGDQFRTDHASLMCICLWAIFHPIKNKKHLSGDGHVVNDHTDSIVCCIPMLQHIGYFFFFSSK